MGFKYETMTPEEKENRGKFFNEGLADFEILSTTQGVSRRSGNDMLVVEMRIWDCKDKSGKATDFMTAKMKWKINDLLESIGHGDDVDGDFDLYKYVGKCGKAMLVYKKDKETDKLFLNINYVPAAPDAATDTEKLSGDFQAPPADEFSDDIPW
jgi:hypothetical protein